MGWCFAEGSKKKIGSNKRFQWSKDCLTSTNLLEEDKINAQHFQSFCGDQYFCWIVSFQSNIYDQSNFRNTSLVTRGDSKMPTNSPKPVEGHYCQAGGYFQNYSSIETMLSKDWKGIVMPKNPPCLQVAATSWRNDCGKTPNKKVFFMYHRKTGRQWSHLKRKARTIHLLKY